MWSPAVIRAIRNAAAPEPSRATRNSATRWCCCYLNRGEGYCGGESLGRCAGIRTAEARKACESLKARAAFADQYDGRAIVDAAHYESFGRVLAAESPDVVFTQWPIDHHRDHRAVSMLTLDAWLKAGRNFALYYYEVAEIP